MKKVSVIIPTFNRAHYLAKAIESVLSQSYSDFELLVIDDGSTDGTFATIEKYQGKLTYRYQNNSGVSAARNTGLGMATGEWIAFLDSDDEWMPGYLERQMEEVTKTPAVCMQTTDCIFTGLSGSTRSYFEINGSINEFGEDDNLFVRNPFRFVVRHGPWQLGSTIILADALRETGGFDANFRLSEDFDLMARVALQGPFRMIRSSLVNIFRREEEISNLSGKSTTDPIGARELNETVFNKLRSLKGLKAADRRAIDELMGANRRAMGNILRTAGRVSEANACYKRALAIDSSIASLGRLILSLIQGK